MRLNQNKNLLIGVFLAALLGLAGGAAYLYFFGSFRITKNPVIKNETSLKQYLGVKGLFPKPLQNINRLVIISQNTWTVTSDCIAETRGKERVFCLEDLVSNGKMTINIYPNANQITLTNPEKADRLLNLLILSALETHFGLKPEAKNPILDNGKEGFIFQW